jgi:hypothetical protein
MITEPGSYRIDEKDYHLDNQTATPSLSRSVIKALVSECPLRAWYEHPRLNPRYVAEEKKIFDIGHAAHALLLEGIDRMAVVNADNWTTKAAKEARDEARKEGKIPVLAKQSEAILGMTWEATCFLAHSELGISDLRDSGDSEISYYWCEHGTWMRVRPDWINHERTLILDYKTTGTSADPGRYQQIATQTGLEIQDAFYRRGVRAVDGTNPRMVFLVQEAEPPYLCSLISMDMMFREMGHQKVEKGIALWRDCLSRNEWPGYTSDIQIIEPKPWALAEWEQRQNPSVSI